MNYVIDYYLNYFIFLKFVNEKKRNKNDKIKEKNNNKYEI